MHVYAILKHVHLTAVGLSGLFFLLRGLWMMQESSLLNAKLVRVLPHIIDTVLLVSAAGLVIELGSIPLWVQVKVVALFVYIFLGVVSFRLAKGWGSKVLAFFAALFVFGFIISVAVTKNPHGFLAAFL
jgi:uncharacterized membrane protein SirB2